MTTTLTPQVRWAQRKDRLYVKIDVNDAKAPKINLDPSGKLSFETTIEGKHYQVDLEFFKEINVEDSKWNIQPRYVNFLIKKKETGPYWDRLLKEEGKKSFLKVDWNDWKDEDEEDEDDGAN